MLSLIICELTWVVPQSDPHKSKLFRVVEKELVNTFMVNNNKFFQAIMQERLHEEHIVYIRLHIASHISDDKGLFSSRKDFLPSMITMFFKGTLTTIF